MSRLKNVFSWESVQEIQKDLEKKYIDDLESLIEFHNETVKAGHNRFMIYDNSDGSVSEEVPEEDRINVGYNSAKAETYNLNDMYVVYSPHEFQLFSFNYLHDDYCPINFETLAMAIWKTLNEEKNQSEPKSYEDICADRYEL